MCCIGLFLFWYNKDYKVFKDQLAVNNRRDQKAKYRNKWNDLCFVKVLEMLV